MLGAASAGSDVTIGGRVDVGVDAGVGATDTSAASCESTVGVSSVVTPDAAGSLVAATLAVSTSGGAHGFSSSSSSATSGTYAVIAMTSMTGLATFAAPDA